MARLPYATQVKADHAYIGLHVPRPTDFSLVKLYAVGCQVRLRAVPLAVCDGLGQVETTIHTLSPGRSLGID